MLRLSMVLRLPNELVLACPTTCCVGIELSSSFLEIPSNNGCTSIVSVNRMTMPVVGITTGVAQVCRPFVPWFEAPCAARALGILQCLKDMEMAVPAASRGAQRTRCRQQPHSRKPVAANGGPLGLRLVISQVQDGRQYFRIVWGCPLESRAVVCRYSDLRRLCRQLGKVGPDVSFPRRHLRYRLSGADLERRRFELEAWLAAATRKAPHAPALLDFLGNRDATSASQRT